MHDASALQLMFTPDGYWSKLKVRSLHWSFRRQSMMPTGGGLSVGALVGAGGAEVGAGGAEVGVGGAEVGVGGATVSQTQKSAGQYGGMVLQFSLQNASLTGLGIKDLHETTVCADVS
jgi:hypothetical protein